MCQSPTHTQGVKPVELDALLDHYGVTGANRAYALDLHAKTIQRPKRGAFHLRP